MTAVGMTARPPARILFCLDSFDIGGSELNAVRTAERLDPQRVELHVAAFRQDGPLRARYEALGVPIEQFSIPNLYGPRAVREGIRFAGFVSRRGIDVVHTHDIYTNMFAIPWGRLVRRPALVASRRWWSETPRAIHKIVNRASYRLADRVLANSPAIARMLEASEHVPHNRVVTIPNFVDDDSFAPPDLQWLNDMRGRLGLRADDLVVGSVANLHAIKNHELLLAATAALAPRWPSLRVVIVGDGQRRGRLRALAAELGIIDHVIFAGLMPQNPSPHHLFDVSVLTSRGEGFPNSIVESMAAGRPIVATAVGGVVDAFTDKLSGRLVPPDDVDALVAAIGFYLCDRDARRAAGSAARQEAAERYHAKRILPLVHQLYDELVSERARRR